MKKAKDCCAVVLVVLDVHAWSVLLTQERSSRRMTSTRACSWRRRNECRAQAQNAKKILSTIKVMLIALIAFAFVERFMLFE